MWVIVAIVFPKTEYTQSKHQCGRRMVVHMKTSTAAATACMQSRIQTLQASFLFHVICHLCGPVNAKYILLTQTVTISIFVQTCFVQYFFSLLHIQLSLKGSSIKNSSSIFLARCWPQKWEIPLNVSNNVSIGDPSYCLLSVLKVDANE